MDIKMPQLKLPSVKKIRSYRPDFSFLKEIKEHWLDFLLYLTCGLPFLKILPIPSDMQPYAFLVALAYLCVKSKKLSLSYYHQIIIWPFLLAAAVAVFDIFFDDSITWMMLIRKCYNYASLFVVSLAMFNSFWKLGIREKWLKGIILLWLFVGLVQKFIDRQFLSFLVSNFRTSETRGVVSLASEPSFYGYVMVFFFVLANEFKRHRFLYQGICVFQIVALGQSAVAIVYLAVFAIMFILKEAIKLPKDKPDVRKRKLIFGGIALGAMALGILIVVVAMPNSRMVQLFRKLVGNLGKVRSLADLYAVDQSVAERVEAIIIGFRGFVQNWGLPNGFGEIIIDGKLFLRVMSGFGSVIYELGIAGLLVVIMTSWVLIKGTRNGFVYGGGIIIIMFSAIQFGSPIFALALANALYARGRSENITVDAASYVKRITDKLFPDIYEDEEDEAVQEDEEYPQYEEYTEYEQYIDSEDYEKYGEEEAHDEDDSQYRDDQL